MGWDGMEKGVELGDGGKGFISPYQTPGCGEKGGGGDLIEE